MKTARLLLIASLLGMAAAFTSASAVRWAEPPSATEFQ